LEFLGVFTAKSCDSTHFTLATCCHCVLYIGLSVCNAYKIGQQIFIKLCVLKVF
jgi:hypothetical protein